MYKVLIYSIAGLCDSLQNIISILGNLAQRARRYTMYTSSHVLILGPTSSPPNVFQHEDKTCCKGQMSEYVEH
jgi:hypothetical protein